MHKNDDLVRRLEMLERRLRRGRAFVTLLALLLIAAVGIGAFEEQDRILKAQGLLIHDNAGQPRIMLSAAKEGAGLVFFRPNGETALSLLSDEKTSTMKLFDDQGKARYQVTTMSDGASLVLLDQLGKPRLGLSLNKDEPSVRIHDGNGNSRAAMALIKDEAWMFLNDNAGEGCAALTQSDHGTFLRLSNGKEKTPRAVLLCEPKTGGNLFLFNEKGEVVGGVASQAK